VEGLGRIRQLTNVEQKEKHVLPVARSAISQASVLKRLLRVIIELFQISNLNYHDAIAV